MSYVKKFNKRCAMEYELQEQQNTKNCQAGLVMRMIGQSVPSRKIVEEKNSGLHITAKKSQDGQEVQKDLIQQPKNDYYSPFDGMTFNF